MSVSLSCFPLLMMDPSPASQVSCIHAEFSAALLCPGPSAPIPPVCAQLLLNNRLLSIPPDFSATFFISIENLRGRKGRGGREGGGEEGQCLALLYHHFSCNKACHLWPSSYCRTHSHQTPHVGILSWGLHCLCIK